MFQSFSELRMAHTILLVQPGGRSGSRIYTDYDSASQAMDGVCKIFEEHLKNLRPADRAITYDISDIAWERSHKPLCTHIPSTMTTHMNSYK